MCSSDLFPSHDTRGGLDRTKKELNNFCYEHGKYAARVKDRLERAESLLRDAQVSMTLTWPLEAERIEKYFTEVESE